MFDLTTDEKYIQFTFVEETVLNGLLISTHKNFSLRSFRIRANSNQGNSHDLETWPELIEGQVGSLFLGGVHLY